MIPIPVENNCLFSLVFGKGSEEVISGNSFVGDVLVQVIFNVPKLGFSSLFSFLSDGFPINQRETSASGETHSGNGGGWNCTL